jgi:hypothetical protein
VSENVQQLIYYNLFREVDERMTVGRDVKLSQVQLQTLSTMVLNLEGRNVNLYDAGFNDYSIRR